MASKLNENSRFGGYVAAASFIAADPDDETLIFRKFNKLAALNLLYLQSEMLDLEAQIDNMHIAVLESYKEPSNIGMPVISAASTWETLVRQSDPTTKDFRQDAKEKMDLIMRLREKLKEYRKLSPLEKR